MAGPLKTTRQVAPVRSIKDVAALESAPYKELVTAGNFYDLFLATARQHGDSPALTVLTGEAVDARKSLTHRSLLSEVTRAANMFRKLGLTPAGGVAAFLSPTLPAMPPLLWGAQVAGRAASLNYLLNREAIVDLLNAQQATILIVPSPGLDATCWTKALGILEEVGTLRHILVIGDDTEGLPDYTPLSQALGSQAAEALDFEPGTNPDTVCALFHTGGTTGRPKIVQLTHGNHIHAAFGFAQVCGYDERDVIIDGFPFFHVGGTITGGLSVLAAGGHVVVPSPHTLRPPEVVASCWDIVRRFEATVISCVPTSLASLTSAWKQGNNAASVRMAVVGGSILPREVERRFEATTGIRVFETYGMTETAAAIAFNPGRGEPLAGSVGFRAPYSQIRVRRLGEDDAVLCTPNESGLVQVRGPQLFPGYLDPAHNEGTFTDDGWLNTGDIGYLTEEDRLVLTGREKDLIVRSGHNIDPATIEEVANRFGGVHISAAVGMPDQYAGELPALFVVPEAGATLDAEALRSHLEAQISERPALPKSILLIDALPVTAVGKVFKPALRDEAIKEKVRLEVARLCGAAAAAKIEVRTNPSKHTLVEVNLFDVDEVRAAALEAALLPLPQTYIVRQGKPTKDGDAVTLAVDGSIATLTLNRPDSLNALSQEVVLALKQRLGELLRLPELRAVIITGAGRAFSAGGDLIEFEAALTAGKERLLHYLSYNQAVLSLVEDLPVPVIGAVNGVAVAGGLELLLCCDILIATEGVKMGDGHSRYGIVPAGGATLRLAEKIAPNRAAELFYTAALRDAETLHDWGLVNEVVPAERLLVRAMELARDIAARSPEANRHIKMLTGHRGDKATRDRLLHAEIERFETHMDGADLIKGLAAFRAKQDPEF